MRRIEKTLQLRASGAQATRPNRFLGMQCLGAGRSKKHECFFFEKKTCFLGFFFTKNLFSPAMKGLPRKKNFPLKAQNFFWLLKKFWDDIVKWKKKPPSNRVLYLKQKKKPACRKTKQNWNKKKLKKTFFWKEKKTFIFAFPSKKRFFFVCAFGARQKKCRKFFSKKARFFAFF